MPPEVKTKSYRPRSASSAATISSSTSGTMRTSRRSRPASVSTCARCAMLRPWCGRTGVRPRSPASPPCELSSVRHRISPRPCAKVWGGRRAKGRRPERFRPVNGASRCALSYSCYAFALSAADGDARTPRFQLSGSTRGCTCEGTGSLLFDYGHIETMAKAVAEGAREAGAEVDVKRVPETAPAEVVAAAHFKTNHDFPEAQPDDPRELRRHHRRRSHPLRQHGLADGLVLGPHRRASGPRAS